MTKGKKRRLKKPNIVTVSLATLLVVTLSVVVTAQFQCQQQEVTVIVCDTRCHKTQAILQLGEWEANRQKRLEVTERNGLPTSSMPCYNDGGEA